MTQTSDEFYKKLEEIQADIEEPGDAPEELGAELEAEVEAKADNEAPDGAEPELDEDELEVGLEEAELPEEVPVERTNKGPMIPKSRFDEVTERAIRAETQYQMLMEALQQRQNNEAPKDARAALPESKPNPYDKSLEYEEWLEYELEQTKSVVSALENKFLEQTNKTQAQTEEEKVVQYTTAGIQAAGAKDPSVYDAYNYVLAVKANEYSPLAKTDAEVARRVDEFILSYMTPSMKKGIDPAQIITALAKNYGFSGKAQPSRRDVTAVERNREKSASAPSSNISRGVNSGPTSIKQVKRKSGRGVDPNGFHKYLERIETGG